MQRELDAAPEGIGGWLILPAIWCVFSPLVHGATGLYWLFLMSVGVYDEALLVPFLISVGMAAYTLFVAIRFFTRKKNVPALMIAWLVLNVVFSIINAAAADKGAGAVVGSLIVAGLWIPYFVSSRRVMKTFVR